MNNQTNGLRLIITIVERKQGKMAKAIRTLMKSIALKEHKRISIEFLDN